MNERQGEAGSARAKAPKQVIIKSMEEIPEFAREEDEAAFWDAHMLSDQLWAELQPVPDEQLPIAREKSRDSNRSV